MQSQAKTNMMANAAGRNDLTLYVIAFIEGGALMASELIAGKIIAPFYGSSLYVWTSVLGCTLGGLAAGYYIGGKLSRSHAGRTLILALLIPTLLLAFMHFISGAVLQATLHSAVQLGSLVSCLVLIFPLILCFGIVSPALIRLISGDEKNVGRAAGNIYAVSTAGGVLMTFAMGFYIIPELGIAASMYILTILLSIATLLTLVKRAHK